MADEDERRREVTRTLLEKWEALIVGRGHLPLCLVGYDSEATKYQFSLCWPDTVDLAVLARALRNIADKLDEGKYRELTDRELAG